MPVHFDSTANNGSCQLIVFQHGVLSNAASIYHKEIRAHEEIYLFISVNSVPSVVKNQISARFPFSSSQILRSEARFLLSSMSISW